MIKCPNCGSTAQIRMGEPAPSRNKCYITLSCECGCGCHFDLDYDVEDFCSSFTHYVDKEMRMIK